MTTSDLPRADSPVFAARASFTTREAAEITDGLVALASRDWGASLDVDLDELTTCWVKATGDAERLADVLELRKAACLDVAASLLELADRARQARQVLDAFALEGIEGRILDALVGAPSSRHGASGGRLR